MFSCTRRFHLFLQGLNTRPLCTKSTRPTATSSPSLSSIGGSRYGDNKDKDLEALLRTITSGVVVVGSTLGFWYWSSLSSPGANSLHSFADYANEDQLEQNFENKSKFLFNEGYRRRVFFKYEKRIRLQSPPEKVFEYFASIRNPGGEVFMTPADLMRAVVPVFPPSESNRVREGSLRGEQVPGALFCSPSEFFMLFDTNNDGLISFAEYIFFVTLLSIPESSFSVAFKMFDLNNNGEIDKEEFKKVMTLMRSQNRQGANHRDGRRLGVKASVENGGLLEYFFSKDGKSCLQHEKFVQFLRNLHDEILRLEFSHYDYFQKGSISAKDFALSLVASADINHINKLLDRVEEIGSDPHLRDIRITFQEFQAVAELRNKLQSFSLALFSYGKVNGVLTKSDFQRAASQVCGITMTDKVADIIFHVFDANRDGNLSASEFVRVVQRENNSSRVGLGGFISCWLNCATNCSSAKLQL
ncbi:unnamed protein product [Lupinus luteus]|uniref:EF-hand domain-containing protein n=1 Tax=Lupinus luteus TaxID=3873 RepID=A0AAV1XWH0_LUPLU